MRSSKSSYLFVLLISASVVTSFVSFAFNTYAIAQEDFVQLNVYAEKVTYVPTEDAVVNITGCAHSSGASLEGQEVLLEIYDPDGQLLWDGLETVDDTCNFKSSIEIKDLSTQLGNYLVRASYEDEVAETAFRISNETNTKAEGECSVEYCTYYFELKAKIYPIQYQITNGTIVAMFVDLPAHALMVITNSTHSGLMTIVLPREIIDSKKDDGTDKEYFVSIGNYSGGEGSMQVDVQDAHLTFGTLESRMLQIDYPAGSMQIQIAGTYFVPEFSPYAGIAIAAISVVGIIVATRLRL